MAQEFLRTMGLAGATGSPHSESRPTPSDSKPLSSVGVIYSDMPVQTEVCDSTTGGSSKEVKTNGQGVQKVPQGTQHTVRDSNTRTRLNHV